MRQAVIALWMLAFLGLAGAAWAQEGSCSDGQDGDGDALIDCADADCWSKAACQFETGCCVVDVDTRTCLPEEPYYDACYERMDRTVCARLIGGPLCLHTIDFVAGPCRDVAICNPPLHAPVLSWPSLAVLSVLLAAGGLFRRRTRWVSN